MGQKRLDASTGSRKKKDSENLWGDVFLVFQLIVQTRTLNTKKKVPHSKAIKEMEGVSLQVYYKKDRDR
ncbi:hypothetical protein OIU74_028653 [Salix koriyanagi]|uniref:Uncharacterized protein n=1 Tax=Salix koriyanagi TaxID=2511006 RepID=A0A9Q0VCT5_9ROSI|nr:hypothetical protein OIU74_028653 [Salix koriyanagi]